LAVSLRYEREKCGSKRLLMMAPVPVSASTRVSALP
jgi:hypothetical protein